MKNALKSALIILCAGGLLTACANISSEIHSPPIVDLGKDPNSKVDFGSQALDKYWLAFENQDLNKITQEIISNNNNLQIALSRVNEARAYLDKADALDNLALSMNSSASFGQQSLNGQIPLKKFPISPRDQNLFRSSFDASWEIDLFGQHKLNQLAAQNNVNFTKAEADAIQMALSAQVVSIFADIQSSKKEIDALNSYMASLQKSAEILKARVEAKDIPITALEDALAKISAFSAQIPLKQARIKADCYALATLAGKPPETYYYLEDNAPVDMKLFNLPLEARAAILARRPDVAAALSKINITAYSYEAAKKELLPKFILSGRGGWEATDIAKLLNPDSVVLAFVPAISWRILDNGAIKAEINAADERQKQALFNYSQVIMAALNDSARAENDYINSLNSLSALQNAITIKKKAFDGAKQRYAAGDISRYDLLIVERELKDLQLEEIRTYGLAMNYQITLFKALGGGWQEVAKNN